MNEETLQLFKTLTELPGAPGFEHKVRDYMNKELTKYADEVFFDNLGGIYGIKNGPSASPRILVSGHMDEVGFLVSGITANGMLKFQPLGGWWSQVLLAQRVHVFTTDDEPIVGIIASTPPHLLDEQTRNKPMDINNMLIDIGADSEADVNKMGIRIGMPIVPISSFTPMHDQRKIMAKAWDNRYGCGLAIELLKELKDTKLPNTLISGATVQEELGLRGAAVAANLTKPDLFFALDSSPADDTTIQTNSFGKIGQGVLLRVLDRSMVLNKNMVDFILDTVRTHNIPSQYFISKGATDAGQVHISNTGIPSAVIGICSRYIHTSTSIIHVDDYAAAKQLLLELVKACDANTVSLLKNQTYKSSK